MKKQFKILIVDDNPDNIRVLVELLKNDYQLNATTNGFDAIDYALSWQPDLILLDVMMPDVSGYNVCIQLKSDPETENIPIIFVTALSDVADELLGLDLGAIDYITKPIIPEHVKIRVKNHIEFKSNKDILNELITYRITKLSINEKRHKMLYNTISNKKDTPHAFRCYEYAKIFLQKLLTTNLYPELLTTDLSEAVCCAALFQDIDMTEVVTNDEIFSDKQLLKTTLDGIKYHHEHWDGSGHPEGLSGYEIPCAARIFSIIDFYDRKACGTSDVDGAFHFEAIKLISSDSEKRFDPNIVYNFLQCQDSLLECVQK